MIPTPEEAWALLCQYNEGEFHRKHGRIVGDVLRWYAIELGYGDEADFGRPSGFSTTSILRSGRSSTAQRSRRSCGRRVSTKSSSTPLSATAIS